MSATCADCGGVMTVYEPDQTVHPNCDPPGADPMPPEADHLPPLDEIRRGEPVEEFKAEIDWLIFDALANSPRSLQRQLGPSEVGHPCRRWLGYRLLEVEPVNGGGVNWRPAVGTGAHLLLGGIFAEANRKLGQPRFLVEHRVDIGTVDGEPIVGSCDLYDRVTARSIDWKISGPDMIRKIKSKGEPAEQYRAQAHAYGRGWARRGFPVDEVSIYYLPSNGEYDQGFFWSEKYDETIAVQALERVEAVAKLTASAGTATLPLLPTTDHYCRRCDYFLPASTDVTEACPGHPGAAL